MKNQLFCLPFNLSAIDLAKRKHFAHLLQASGILSRQGWTSLHCFPCGYMPEIVTHLKLLLWQRQRVGIKFSGCFCQREND